MKVNLIYNFDDLYINGRDTINIKADNFVYTVDVKKNNKMTYEKLKEKYWEEALKDAAFKTYWKYGEFIN